MSFDPFRRVIIQIIRRFGKSRSENGRPWQETFAIGKKWY